MNRTKALSLATFLFAAMGGVLYGYDLGIISGALLFLRHDIPMTDDQMSFLVAAVLGGGAFATLITGPLSDWWGRRRMILVSSVIFIISVFIIVLANSYAVLLAGRIVQGVGVGVITIAVPLYLTESMPAHLRGRGVTAFQLLLAFGILLASLVGLAFTGSGDWRGMFLSAAVPGVIMFFGCFLLSDSPRWLAMKGRYEQALAVLRKTRSEDEAQHELKQMKSALESGRKGFAVPKLKLMQKRYLLPLFIVFAVAICNQLTGINSFLQFSAVILKNGGLDSNVIAMLGSTAITGLNFVMTLIAISLSDKIERKYLVSFGTGGIVLALAYCGFIYWWLPLGMLKGYMLLGGILAFIFFYAVGPGALVWAILSELLPSRIRGTGLAVALFLNSMTSTILASVFLGLVHHIGYTGLFWLCGCFTIFYFLVAACLVPKTKGKSLEDIEASFAS